VSPCTLLDAEVGVCAFDKGCACPLPKHPRAFWGRPWRAASKAGLRKGAGVVLPLSELSSDILFLVLEAAAPGMANSPSNAGLGRGVFEGRCDIVDFRIDVVRRTGVLAVWAGEKLKPVCASVYTGGVSSSAVRGAGG
jgi:hypothetical protein